MAQFCMISSKPGGAEVFLLGAEQKWENIWGAKKTSKVQFCSSNGRISFKVIADEERKENEYQINQGLRVVANRQNSVQVTLLGGGSDLIFLIKFSNASSAEEFLMKVNNDPVLRGLQNNANPQRAPSGPDGGAPGRPDGGRPDRDPWGPDGGRPDRAPWGPDGGRPDRDPWGPDGGRPYRAPLGPDGGRPDHAPWGPDGGRPYRAPLGPDGGRPDRAPWGADGGRPDRAPWGPDEGRPDRAPREPDGGRPDRAPWGPDGGRPDRDPWGPDGGRPDRAPWGPDGGRPDRAPRGPDGGRPDRAPRGPDGGRPDSFGQDLRSPQDAQGFVKPGNMAAYINSPPPPPAGRWADYVPRPAMDDVPRGMPPMRDVFIPSPSDASMKPMPRHGGELPYGVLPRGGFDGPPKKIDPPPVFKHPNTPAGFEKLCNQLTESIDAGDTALAKRVLNLLLTFDKGPGKFQAKCIVPEQVKPVYMALTVSVEFQKTKQPLKVYFDIDQNASFSDLQLLVEEQLKIPCATQNWIVGDKLVSTGDLKKKLADYGIKKDSKEPPLYLYVVHPKKACVSKEELMRVGITQPLAVQSDTSQPGMSQGPGDQGYGPRGGDQGYGPRGMYYREQERVQSDGPDVQQRGPLPQGGPIFQQHGIPPEAFLPPGKVQPPLPPPPPPKPVGWECPVCTFINKPTRPGCEACSGPRPEDYKVPNDASLDVREKTDDESFKKFLEQEEQEKLKQRDQNLAALMQAEGAPLNTNTEEFECLICTVPVPAGEGVILRECLHEFCKACLREHINACQEAEVKCPFNNAQFSCQSTVQEREIRALLTEQELDNFENRGLRIAENADGMHSFHCRTPNCKGFCFYDDNVNEFTCQVCNKKNCILCKAIHDGMNCQQYQDDLKRRAANDEAAKATQEMLEGMIKNGEAMKCPTCAVVVMKKDGCDWIRCSMCKTEICWATKGPRWGPKGNGDTSAGCKCRVGGKKCAPLCRNCH